MKRPVRLTTETLPEVGQKAFTTPTEQASLLAESKAYTDSIAAGKQDPLVSGTNIKTINSSSILGSGNLSITASDPAYAYGSFTVATGTYKLLGKRLELTTTQQAQVIGTGRLAIRN